MDLKKFFIYTGLGGAIWMSTLLGLGYFIGKNQALAVKYLPMIKIGIFVFIAVLLVAYLLRNAHKNRRQAA